MFLSVNVPSRSFVELNSVFVEIRLISVINWLTSSCKYVLSLPVFVSEDSLCHDVGNLHLRDINTPAMPNRHTWAHKLAYTEWFEHEIEQGLPWKRIKKRLEEKYLK